MSLTKQERRALLGRFAEEFNGGTRLGCPCCGDTLEAHDDGTEGYVACPTCGWQWEPRNG